MCQEHQCSFAALEPFCVCVLAVGTIRGSISIIGMSSFPESHKLQQSQLTADILSLQTKL